MIDLITQQTGGERLGEGAQERRGGRVAYACRRGRGGGGEAGGAPGIGVGGAVGRSRTGRMDLAADQ
jgi:hypothetical protein